MTGRTEVIAEGIVLHLGDSREVVPGLGPLDAVVTDPPYGMAWLSKASSQTGRHARIAGDDDTELLLWAIGLRPKHSTYCFCRWDNLVGVPRPKSVIVWVKNSWSMGDLEHEHARQTEIALFYPGPDHVFPRGRPSDVLMKAISTGNKHHPTEKPVDLMERIVGFTSGIVVDPFMGSGTTGVACIRAGRPFVGVEIDPGYFDIACRRMADETRQLRMF